MPRFGLSLILARLGFLAIVLLIVPVTALIVLYAPPFEAWRWAKAEQLLSDAIDLKTTVSGPVQIGFGFEPSISIAGIAGQDDDMPADLKAVTAKNLSLRISVCRSSWARFS
jgi:hypothetical protein